MGISPLYQGDTLPALQATILDDSNNPLDLTGLTLTNFSVVIKNLYTGQVLTGAGFWTVGPDPTKGVVTYSWNAADTATAGVWQVQIAVQLIGGVSHPDPQIVVIVPLP